MKEKKLWFKAKRYGYGWYPVSCEGWTVTVLCIYAILKGTWYLGPTWSLKTDLFYIFTRVFIPVICLLVICYAKGEKPRWRWGKDT